MTSLSLFTFMHWRRKWQPTPAFLPVESQGGGSLVGCRLWGRTELDTTEATQQQQQQQYIKLRVSAGRKAGRIKINDDKAKRLTKKSTVLTAR